MPTILIIDKSVICQENISSSLNVRIQYKESNNKVFSSFSFFFLFLHFYLQLIMKTLIRCSSKCNSNTYIVSKIVMQVHVWKLAPLFQCHGNYI